MTDRLGVSVALGHDLVQHLEGAALRRVVRHADDAGLTGLWVTDHPAVPLHMESTYPYSADGTPPFPAGDDRYDPFVLLAYLGAATERIRLGTAVYILPVRHPIVVARAAATLDRLTDGRVVLGVGVGWLASEFAALDESFADRGPRTDEGIGLLRRLWTGEPVASDGPHHVFDTVVLAPTPLQGTGLPVFVGGESRAAMRRAARLGDGWIGMVHDPAGSVEVITRLREICAEEGREGPLHSVVHAPRLPTAADVAGYTAAGVDEVKVGLVGRGLEPTEAVARTAVDQLAGVLTVERG